MLILDKLYAEEKPESIEISLDLECQESLATKISPCLYTGQIGGQLGWSSIKQLCKLS